MGEGLNFNDEDDGMNFSKCLDLILMGRKVRRIDWPDDGTFLAMIDEKLMIFTPEDRLYHPLIVSREDALSTDWVVYTGKS